MLIPSSSCRYQALTELTGQSYLLEQRLRPITEEMNSHPLRVNARTWEKNLDAVEENAEFLIGHSRQLAKDAAFRPNSKADCIRILQTSSTDKDSLTELANKGNELASFIIEARSTISRRSQLRKWKTHALMGKVQPYWCSTGTPQGRYTSDSPCLNNRIDLIRETIEADPGYSFLSLDLGQAEYVVWASLSSDPVLTAAFSQGVDFHISMAEMVKSLVPEWNPGEDVRAAGKMLNFAILYQMGAFALARKLGCSQETAERIITSYYTRASKAAMYITDLLARAEGLGFVETYFGRRRYCLEYQTASSRKEAHAIEKTLWSHVNAGTAAEVTKWKQVRVWEGLRKEGFTDKHVRIAIQMYDETVWMVRDNFLDEVRAIAEVLWSQPEEGFIPFRSKVKSGKTWGELKK